MAIIWSGFLFSIATFLCVVLAVVLAGTIWLYFVSDKAPIPIEEGDKKHFARTDKILDSIICIPVMLPIAIIFVAAVIVSIIHFLTDIYVWPWVLEASFFLTGMFLFILLFFAMLVFLAALFIP